MSSRTCPHEHAVTAAARSGDWSPELSAHRDNCLSCAELTLVMAAMAADAEALSAIETPLPDPGSIWLRARLATRERDFHRATRSIVWVQRATVAVVLAIGLAFMPGLWSLLKRLFSTVDISSPVSNLPRAAGSPLMVLVISMLVLGGLALWELTVAQEN